MTGLKYMSKNPKNFGLYNSEFEHDACGVAFVANMKGVEMLKAATAAPDFTLPDQSGNLVSLSSFKGKWVLLWWYPKAGTPG